MRVSALRRKGRASNQGRGRRPTEIGGQQLGSGQRFLNIEGHLADNLLLTDKLPRLMAAAAAISMKIPFRARFVNQD